MKKMLWGFASAGVAMTATLWLTTGCHHAPETKPWRPMGPDFATNLALLRQFEKSLPFYPPGLRALTVEELWAKDAEPLECVFVRGRLVLDSEPISPDEYEEPPRGSVPAKWILLGDAALPRNPPAVRFLGIPPHPHDEHALFLENDVRFEEPREFCGGAQEGEARMNGGRPFTLPTMSRESVRAPDDGEMPMVPVIISARIGDKPWAPMTATRLRDLRLAFRLDLSVSRICRLDDSRAVNGDGHGIPHTTDGQ